MAAFQYGTNEQSQREQPPARAPPDMENELESGACAMAKAFYDTYGSEAIQINDRRQLGMFFASKQHLLLENQDLYAACTKNGREDARRHWSQVLFSLCRHGKVLKVEVGGSWIEWKTDHTTPETLQIAKMIAANPILLRVFRERIPVGHPSVSAPPSSPASVEDGEVDIEDVEAATALIGLRRTTTSATPWSPNEQHAAHEDSRQLVKEEERAVGAPALAGYKAYAGLR